MTRILSLLAAALLMAACAGPRGPAPVDDRRPAPAPKPAAVQAVPATQPAAKGFYTVKRGDTLYSIALEHGVDYRELAQWNRLDDPGKIRAGQSLRVASPDEKPAVRVGAARGAGAVESRPLSDAAPAAAADPGTKTAPKALRLPYSEQNLALLQKGDAAKPAPQQAASTPAPAPAAARDGDIGAVELVWPIKGKILAGFSEPLRKGIDVDASAGAPIVAAAPGKVIFVGTGTEIPGLGKFVVIKHENDINTVYAHLSAIVVKKDQAVSRSQKIAEVGSTDADRPKLHFQVRKLGRALDPLRYLPPS
jgi:lipoprotein NlpD